MQATAPQTQYSASVAMEPVGCKGNIMAGFGPRVRDCLLEQQPVRKVAGVIGLSADAAVGVVVPASCGQAYAVDEPGRPSRPELVPPQRLAGRGFGSHRGRAIFVHAICHIEFNAINLALDACLRFVGLPSAYYRDWLSVAADEARHYLMLMRRLRQLGFEYGDFPAHDGLWSMARRTRHDPLQRMALVPRVLEARGLDVTPGMISRLRRAGDEQTAALLGQILEEEIGHVAIGSKWFLFLCEQRGLDPEETFAGLLSEFLAGPPRGPFNADARMAAGFSRRELDLLERLQEQA